MLDIDLVLSGSGARLSAHAGALCALVDSEKFLIRRVAGVSGGAIIAAGYSAIGADKLKQLSIETEFGDLVREARGLRILRFLTKNGLYTGNKIEKFITKNFGKKMMSQLPGLYILSTDLISKETVVMSAKTFPTLDISKAVRRSLSIPFIFIPNYRKIMARQYCFVDGGVSNNYPIGIFDDESRPTIGVRLVGRSKQIPPSYKMGLKEFSGAIVETMMAEIERKHVEDAHWANTVEVDTGDISSTDFDISREKKEWLFDQGYEAVKKFIHKRYPTS